MLRREGAGDERVVRVRVVRVRGESKRNRQCKPLVVLHLSEQLHDAVHVVRYLAEPEGGAGDERGAHAATRSSIHARTISIFEIKCGTAALKTMNLNTR